MAHLLQHMKIPKLWMHVDVKCQGQDVQNTISKYRNQLNTAQNIRYSVLKLISVDYFGNTLIF